MENISDFEHNIYSETEQKKSTSPKVNGSEILFDIVKGKSQVMQDLLKTVKLIAVTDHPVLITGPTGSGKEVIGNLIHHQNLNPNAPFVDVNCGAIPENLVESQFFGHEKGSFTGAVAKHSGYFSTVQNGTLFLDEIAELPLMQQTKLLRVLETRSFRPVGSSSDHYFEGRIIAATNADLDQMVKDKKFREDLFYRLNVFALKVPGLNERQEDIPDFVLYFANRQARALTFTKDAMLVFLQADWPGNIRQLKNVIDKIAVLCSDHFITGMTVNKFLSDTPSSSADDLLQRFAKHLLHLDIENKLPALEFALINQAINESRGNKSKAAKMLGVHRKYIERRINSFNIDINEVQRLYNAGVKEFADDKYEDACQYFKKALKTFDKYKQSIKLDELKVEILTRLALCCRNIYGWAHLETIELFNKAENLSIKLKNVEQLSIVIFGLWAAYLVKLDLKLALNFAEKYLKEGKAINNSTITTTAYITVANTHFWMGNFEKASDALEQFISAYSSDNELFTDYSQNPFVFYLMFLSLINFQTGHLKKSRKNLKQLLSYAGKLNDNFVLAVTLQTAAWVEFKFGCYQSSYEYAEKLTRLSIENKFLLYHGVGMMFRGYYIAETGHFTQGVEQIKKGYQEITDHGGIVFNSLYAIILGKIYWNNGCYSKGMELIKSSIKISEEHNELCYISEQVCLRGKFYLLNNQLDKAEKDFRKAILLSKQFRSKTMELKACNELAKLLILSGNKEDARKILIPIVLRFEHEYDDDYYDLIHAQNILNQINAL